VDRKARSADERVGPLVPVAVARADVRQGMRLTPAAATRAFAVRQAPARFVPPDTLPSPSEAVGGTLAVPLKAGSYLTAAALSRRPGPGGGPAPVEREGERTVELYVAAGPDVLAAGPGARVDVLVTTGGDSGRGRSYLALEDVELAAVRAGAADSSSHGGGGEGAAGRANAVATLHVTLQEAVFLTAADTFARELRLLLRPQGEKHSGRAIAVSDSAL
jgi:pilus assembly protein CpaB